MVTTTASTGVASRTGAVLGTLKKMPSIRRGPAPAVGSLLTSLLGVVFWLLATSRFRPSELGVSWLLIALSVLVADLADVGLGAGLARLRPAPGDQVQRPIVRAYAGAAVGALAASVVVVAGLSWVTPDLIDLPSAWSLPLTFLVVTATRAVLVVGDGALAGVGLVSWVPIEQAALGVARIVLVLALAGAGADIGAFLAWAVPVPLVALAVNTLLFRTLRSGHETPTPTLPPTSRPVRRWPVSGSPLLDWAGEAARSAPVGLLPLLVLIVDGAGDTARYLLAWTVAVLFHLAAGELAVALVADAAADEGNVDRRSVRGVVSALALAAPVVVVAVVAAPWLLARFGSGYTGAAPTLRLLLLATLPELVVRARLSRLRADGRRGRLLTHRLVLGLGVLALGSALVGPLGIVGPALAWLVGLTVAAGHALVVETVWWWAPRLGAGAVGVVNVTDRRIRRAKQRRPVLASRRQLQDVVGQLYATPPPWRRERYSKRSQTVLVAAHEGRPPLQVEVARTRWGAEILSKRVEAIAGLGELTGLASFRALLPYPIEHHTGPGPAYLVESAHSGRLGHHLADEVPIDDLVAEVVTAIDQLHRATAGSITLDDTALERWVSRPVRDLRKAGQVPPGQLQRIEQVIRTALAGELVPSARIHGSLVLANTRFDLRNHLTGITRWEWSEPGPVLLDRGVLALSARTARGGTDLGAVMTELLDRPEALWEDPALDAHERGSLDPRAAVLLCWLHLLGPAIRGPVGAHPGRYWYARSVRTVVNRLPRTAPVAA